MKVKVCREGREVCEATGMSQHRMKEGRVTAVSVVFIVEEDKEGSVG